MLRARSLDVYMRIAAHAEVLREEMALRNHVVLRRALASAFRLYACLPSANTFGGGDLELSDAEG